MWMLRGTKLALKRPTIREAWTVFVLTGGVDFRIIRAFSTLVFLGFFSFRLTKSATEWSVIGIPIDFSTA